MKHRLNPARPLDDRPQPKEPVLTTDFTDNTDEELLYQCYNPFPGDLRFDAAPRINSTRLYQSVAILDIALGIE